MPTSPQPSSGDYGITPADENSDDDLHRPPYRGRTQPDAARHRHPVFAPARAAQRQALPCSPATPCRAIAPGGLPSLRPTAILSVTLTLNDSTAATVSALDFEWDVTRPSAVKASQALFNDSSPRTAPAAIRPIPGIPAARRARARGLLGPSDHRDSDRAGGRRRRAHHARRGPLAQIRMVRALRRARSTPARSNGSLSRGHYRAGGRRRQRELRQLLRLERAPHDHGRRAQDEVRAGPQRHRPRALCCRRRRCLEDCDERDRPAFRDGPSSTACAAAFTASIAAP